MSQDLNIISWLREWFDNDYGQKGHTHTSSQVTNIVDVIYPVGSIYISERDTNPATLFGGYWVKIEDRFLLSAGSSYTLGATGGAATVTLTANQSGLKAHNHTFSHDHPLPDSRQYVTHTSGAGITEVQVPNGTHHYTPSISSGTSDNWWGVSSTSQPSNANSGDVSAANASEAHNNMPPYLVVNVWERISENRYQYNNLQITNVEYYYDDDGWDTEQEWIDIHFNNSFIQQYKPYKTNITATINGDIDISNNSKSVGSTFIQIDVSLNNNPSEITITLPSITINGETFPAKTFTHNNIGLNY